MMKTSVGICLVPSFVAAHAASGLMPPLPPAPLGVVPVVMIGPVVVLGPVVIELPVVVAPLPPASPPVPCPPVVVALVLEREPLNVDSLFLAAHPKPSAARNG